MICVLVGNYKAIYHRLLRRKLGDRSRIGRATSQLTGKVQKLRATVECNENSRRELSVLVQSGFELSALEDGP